MEASNNSNSIFINGKAQIIEMLQQPQKRFAAL